MKPSAIRIERMLEKIEAALVPPPRKYLRVIIHEGDNQAAAQEKALAEHVACHPEDVGRTVQDFNWIVREIVPPTIGADGRPRWLGDTDGPSETLEPIETPTLEPIDLPPPDPPCLARSKPWRPVHQRPARDQRRPTWNEWSRNGGGNGNGHGG